MTELEALRWVQDQPGLKMLVGKDRRITLTNGQTVEISGNGLLDTVVKLQNVLRIMRDTRESHQASCSNVGS